MSIKAFDTYGGTGEQQTVNGAPGFHLRGIVGRMAARYRSQAATKQEERCRELDI
ncbi:MAG TPA: hypothetical protein VGC48_07115 [Gemmatimonadales bacterium]